MQSQNPLDLYTKFTPMPTTFDGDDPNWALLARQQTQAQQQVQPAKPTVPEVELPADDFIPAAPESLEALGLSEPQIQGLALKFLLNMARGTGRAIANQLGIPFRMIESLLHGMKAEQLVVYTASNALGDYEYELTPRGIELAHKYSQYSSYFGTAPVPLDQYEESVRRQSVKNTRLTMDSIRECFDDLVIRDELLMQLGEAMHMGRGLFVHGAPGNGKTSICERVMNSFSEAIWIPRALNVGGEVIRLFDPIQHVPLPLENEAQLSFDRRWIRIRRPTLIVGGELRLSQLDVSTNPLTGISEAPLLLKGNCGSVVIDDFGRQRFEIAELLNRLIVPMEKGFDCLNLTSGRSFRVPFEPLLVFSTNLNPTDLIDEAFSRRIPFSLEVHDPSEDEYRQVLRTLAQESDVECSDEIIDYLLAEHYRNANRPLRFCHPRDIVNHVRNACDFHGEPLALTRERVDIAVQHVQQRA